MFSLKYLGNIMFPGFTVIARGLNPIIFAIISEKLLSTPPERATTANGLFKPNFDDSSKFEFKLFKRTSIL